MKKKWLLLIIVISIVLVGGVLGSLLWKPDPNQLVQHGLEKLNGAVSFRYTVTQHQWIDGKDRILTQIQGEKDGGNSHILGQLVGSEVEMILVDDVWYNKDPFSQKWIKFANSASAQEVFLAEINPLSSLQLKEPGEVVLSGREKIGKTKVWVCTLNPTVQNQIMEEFWTDFSYTLYIERSSKNIVRAIIEAKSKEKGQPMSMTLDFRDINKKISILPPEQ